MVAKTRRGIAGPPDHKFTKLIREISADWPDP